MLIKAMVDENGGVKIDNPQWFGKEVEIYINETHATVDTNGFNWEKLEAALQKARTLDIKRRNTEEIMRDINEMRGRE